jgi:hypothetical protein
MARRGRDDEGFSEDERFSLFVKRADELLSRRLVTSGGLDASFNLSFSQQTPLQLQTIQPDEEDLRSFLMTFRLFISNDEATFVERISNLLWLRLEGDRVRANLVAARDRWQASVKTGPMAVVINDQGFSPAKILDLWINGHYFHTDKRKAADLERLDPMSTVLTRYVLMDHLVEGTKYVVFLANVILGALSEGLL